MAAGARLADRTVIYQLYHLLNHLNLFGGAYRGQAMAIVRRSLSCLKVTRLRPDGGPNARLVLLRQPSTGQGGNTRSRPRPVSRACAGPPGLPDGVVQLLKRRIAQVRRVLLPFAAARLSHMYALILSGWIPVPLRYSVPEGHLRLSVPALGRLSYQGDSVLIVLEDARPSVERQP